MSALYEKDFCAWSCEQADSLKKGDFKNLDLENLREEIESLGISVHRALGSYLENILMHKLKITFQPNRHTKSWDYTISEGVLHVEELIDKNPSLKNFLHDIFKRAYLPARLRAATETNMDVRIFPIECPWTVEEILDTKKGE